MLYFSFFYTYSPSYHFTVCLNVKVESAEKCADMLCHLNHLSSCKSVCVCVLSIKIQIYFDIFFSPVNLFGFRILIYFSVKALDTVLSHFIIKARAGGGNVH